MPTAGLMYNKWRVYANLMGLYELDPELLRLLRGAFIAGAAASSITVIENFDKREAVLCMLIEELKLPEVCLINYMAKLNGHHG